MVQQTTEQPVEAAWHTLDRASVCASLDATEHGLSHRDAESRLARHGPNAIPRRPPPAIWAILLRQFRSPIIYILLLAAIVSLAIGHVTDAGFIAAVVVFNALIGGVQEQRAEKSARALQGLLRTRASVERDGEVRDIDAEAVVPGDVVWLEPGVRVPADLRLLTAHGLEVDESLLTGESAAVDKDAAWTGPEKTVLGDRRNMAYAGSMVVRGRAKGLVATTGSGTHVGRLALDVLGAEAGEAPLLVRLRRFTRTVGVSVLIAAIVIGVVGTISPAYELPEMFMFAVALAVSAIPEGLPVAITVALSVAARRMAKRGVIVRTLGAVEGLGSCTFIASDKTGTLTCNELTVRRIELGDRGGFEVTGEGYAPLGQIVQGERTIERGEHELLDALARAAVLCNEADLHVRDAEWSWRGDPTDIALLSMAHKLGWRQETTWEKHPQFNQIAFEPELRFAASYHHVGDRKMVFVKGAPERVLAMCDRSAAGFDLDQLHRAAEAFAERGYRVLAFADGEAPEALDEASPPPEPSGLRFLGFVGMIDPLRPGAKEAVKACHAAGIEVSMVTGDHPVTALAIARDLGFADSPEQVVTGQQIAEMSEKELGETVAKSRVFARVAPHQKLDIVNAAQRANHFVAVTGDGVNDAPALRAANISVAMGRAGTDVAREAADLVISDDNFATIVAGVEEGRVAFDNIRKVVLLLLSTGAAEVVLVGLAVATGSFLPLLPAQLLWLNLVTNGIQHVALAFEPNEGDVLERPPRPPRERIFNDVMITNVLFSAVVMGLLAFGEFWWLVNQWELEPFAASNVLLLQMVLFENVHIGNCRSETKSPFHHSPLRSPILLIGAATAFLVHVGAMYWPFAQSVLRTEPVDLRTWAVVIAVALVFFFIVAAQKWVMRHRSH